MNKSELVDAIASEAGLTKDQATKALNAFTSSVQGALERGDDVVLVGFGAGLTWAACVMKWSKEV